MTDLGGGPPAHPCPGGFLPLASCALEEDGGEGREAQVERVRPAVGPDAVGFDAAPVPPAAAAVLGAGVAVEHFLPVAAPGDAEAVVAAGHGGEVADDEDEVVSRAAAAEEADDTLGGVAGIHPLEAAGVEVELVQGGLGAVEAVQVGDPLLQAGVAVVLGEVPVEAALVVPLVPLAELAPHEEQLL